MKVDRYDQVVDTEGRTPLDRAWDRVPAGDQRGPDALRQAQWEAAGLLGLPRGSEPDFGERPEMSGLPDPDGTRGTWGFDRWLVLSRPGGGERRIDLWFYADWGHNHKLGGREKIKSRWQWDEVADAYEYGYDNQPLDDKQGQGRLDDEPDFPGF